MTEFSNYHYYFVLHTYVVLVASTCRIINKCIILGIVLDNIFLYNFLKTSSIWYVYTLFDRTIALVIFFTFKCA